MVCVVDVLVVALWTRADKICEVMMKADSRLNEEVEGSRYFGILWQEYWKLCQSATITSNTTITTF